jgi:aspartate/methionine/tyrosine aminotransferase
MKIALHEMEPWLIEFQRARFNLAESGVLNRTVGELLARAGTPLDALGSLSLENMDTRGSASLRDAVAGLYPGASADSVLITTGTSEALFLYFHHRFRPGANVVVPVPAFQSLHEVPRYLGYEVRTLALDRARGFRPDLDALAAMVDGDTRCVVVNNPHNPTGVVFTDGELREIRRIADRVGAEVLADEHYRFFPYDDAELLPSLYEEGGPVIAVGSMIKCFGCVGLRVGWLLGPRSLLAELRDLKDYTTHTVCSVSEFIAERALRGWAAIVPEYRRWILANAAAFAALVRRHEDVLGWVPAQGGVVCFPWFRDGRDTQAFARGLVERTGVFVLPGGASFDMGSHFRLGFGVPPEDFGRAMDSLSGFLAEPG